MPITQARMESLALAGRAALDAHNAATRALQTMATDPTISPDVRALAAAHAATVMAMVPPEAIETITSELAWIRMTKNRNAFTKEYNRAKRAGEPRTRTLTAPKVLAPTPTLSQPLEVERIPPARAAQPHRHKPLAAPPSDAAYEAAIERSIQQAIAEGYNPSTGLFEPLPEGGTHQYKRPDGTEVTIDKTGVVDPDQLSANAKKKGLF